MMSLKMHSRSFVGIMLSCEVFPCQPAAYFWEPYHGMISEGLLSIHHRLQIHCIGNVNICIKGPNDRTIVFCRSLQIHKYDKKYISNFCKRTKGKIIITTRKLIGHILKNKQKSKCACIHEIIPLVAMKMNKKMKSRSDRYDINRSTIMFIMF